MCHVRTTSFHASTSKNKYLVKNKGCVLLRACYRGGTGFSTVSVEGHVLFLVCLFSTKCPDRLLSPGEKLTEYCLSVGLPRMCEGNVNPLLTISDKVQKSGEHFVSPHQQERWDPAGTPLRDHSINGLTQKGPEPVVQKLGGRVLPVDSGSSHL